MNAIVAYMAPHLVDFAYTSNVLFAGLAKHLGIFGNVLVAFGAVGVLWLGLYYMYRHRTFIRI
jgi:predicted acyltransferase